MNHGKRSINRDWEIQLAWFSAATARYLDLGLTAKQRLCVFLECLQVAMSHGDIELIATVEDFIQKVTEMTKYMKLGEAHLKKEEYDDAILYSKKCLDIAQERGDKMSEMAAYKMLGNAHLNKEEYDDAISYSRKCLDIAQEYSDKEAEMDAYFTLGDAHLEKNECDDAISYSKKCLRIAQECGNKVAEMNAYYMLGDVHWKKEEYDDAISYSKKSLGIAQECGNNVAEMNAYLTLGDAHLKKEEYNDTISYSKECLRIAQECGNKVAEMNAYYMLGDVHWKKEEYDDAISYSKKSLGIAQECGHKVAEMNAYNTLGAAHLKKEEYNDAISYSKKCLDIAQERGDKMSEMAAYKMLGIAHLNKEEYDDAISYSRKCLDIAQEYSDKVAEMVVYTTLGNAHLKKNECDDAIAYGKKCLGIAQECGDKVAEMVVYTTLGNAHLKKKEYDDSILYSKKCLDIAQECGDRVAEVNTYLTLGDAHFKKEEYDDAISYSKKCLDIAQECGHKVAEMNAYYLLGAAHFNKEEYDDAISYSKKCLGIVQECDDKVIEMNAYYLLGDAHLKEKQYDDAILNSKKCFDIAQECGDKVAEMVVYTTLGDAHLKKKEYDDAISYSKKCLTIAQECGEKVAEMNAYLTLGDAHLKKEEYDDAISYSKKCLDIAQECGHKVAEMHAYLKLGDAHFKKEEYDDAISYSKEGLDIAQECGEKVAEMNAYLTLGDAHLKKEEYNDTISYSKEGLDIAQECGEKVAEMNAYLTLGASYLNKREYDSSYTYLDKAMKIATDTLNKEVVINIKLLIQTLYDEIGLKETPWTEDVLLRVNELYFESYINMEKLPALFMVYCERFSLHILQQEYQEAGLCLQKALAIAAEHDDCSSPQLLSYKYRISEMYRSMHQYDKNGCWTDKAKQYYQEALNLAVGTKNNNLQAECHLGLAKIYYELEKFENAEESFKESMKDFEVVFDNLGQNDRFKMAFVDKYTETYKMLLKVLIQGNKKEEALLLSERYRARALKDLLISSYEIKSEETGQQSLQYTDVQTLVSSSNYTLVFYSTCFGDLCTFLIGCKELEFSVQPFKYCDTCLDKIVNETFDEMQVRQVVSCEDRSLEAMEGIEEGKNPNPEEDELTQLLSRVKEKRLSEQCRTICDCRGDPSENSDKSSMTSSLGILYHKLIPAVMCSINKDEVVIIPEGHLNKVPFAALRDPKTGQYLSQRKRIRLAPSMTTLKLIQECPVNYYSETGALIIGDPLVGRVMMNGVEREFKPLYGALEEAADVALILEVRPLLGREATKPKVIEKLHKGVSIVHIAAHARLDKATIVLAPSEETKAKKTPNEEDYMLTMADVQQTQVRAQLVVLSCCHSGRGEIKAEGVVGMCRAFLASGARAVVASLWAISDRVTRKFMKKFYKYLKEGKSAGTSLHLTMKYMREKPEYSEPKYWAPFFLMGDDVTIQL